MNMYYNILKINIPDAEHVMKPDPSSFLPAIEKPVIDDYDDASNFGEKAQDYYDSLCMFCTVLGKATEQTFFLENPVYCDELLRHAGNIIFALSKSNVLDSDEDLTYTIAFGDEDWDEKVDADKKRLFEIREQIRFVLESLCYYGQFEWVYDYVISYYEDFLKDENDLDFRFDFSELYLKTADLCLFHYHNLFYASRFYTLAALDWEKEFINASYEIESPVSESDKSFAVTLAQKTVKLWEEKENPYAQCFFRCDEISLSQAFDDLVAEADRIRARIDFDDARDEIYTQLDDLIQKYDELVKNTNQAEVHSGTAVELRCLTGLLLVMRYALLPDLLPRLAKEEDKENYCDAALSCFVENPFPDTNELCFIQEYVAEEIIGYRDWVRAKSIDIHNVKAFHTVLRLAEFSQKVQKILKLLSVPSDKTTKIAYYTSYENFGHMFWKKIDDPSNYGRIPLFHVAYMNDPNEGRILAQFLTERQKQDTVRKNLREPYVYLKCFTDLIDDLPMWEMYGDGARGICVVLSGDYYPVNPERAVVKDEPLKLSEKRELPLYHVLYMKKCDKPEKYELLPGFNNAISEDTVDEIQKYLAEMKELMVEDIAALDWYVNCMAELRYLFKDADYYHENETRVISMGVPGTFELTEKKDKDEDTPRMLFQYMNGYPEIEEIVIGPKFENRAKRVMYLQAMMDQVYRSDRMMMKSPRITLSTIDYR